MIKKNTRSLADLVSAFGDKTTTSSGNDNWKKFFPFWKADVGSTTIIRFLPDLDDQNPFGFLVENLTHELIVNGRRQKVPCLKMYGEQCPCCDLSAKYYDKKSTEHNETLGKKYYRKKSYIGQILVVSSPIEFSTDTLVHLIDFGPAIWNQIQAGFQSGDLEANPTDLVEGYNFRIKKTKSGEYASYSTSSFAPKATAIEEEIMEKLDLYNLVDFREARIDRATMEAYILADQTGASVEDESSGDVQDNSVLGRLRRQTADDATVTESVTSETAASTKTEDAPQSIAPASASNSVLERLRRQTAAAAAARTE